MITTLNFAYDVKGHCYKINYVMYSDVTIINFIAQYFIGTGQLLQQYVLRGVKHMCARSQRGAGATMHKVSFQEYESREQAEGQELFVWQLNSDSGVQDLSKAHNFQKGVDTIRKDGASQGFVLLPSGSSLIKN